MPAHGYLIYLVRAGVSRRPTELYRLNEVGDNDLDLLGLLSQHLNALGMTYHAVEKNAEGFRIKEVAARGRTLWLKINRGPAGSPGETYDLDTDQSVDTTDRQAQLNELRAMFAFPADSYYGLLFVERNGRRNLRDLLHTIAIKPAIDSTGSTIRVEGFAELGDWERILSDMDVLRVSESLVKHETGHDASTVADTLIQISAEGGRIRRVSASVKGIFSSRIHRRDERLDLMQRTSALGEERRQATADGVTFQNENEYQEITQQVKDLNVATPTDDSLIEVMDDLLEIDRDVYSHKRFEFALGHERPERNIIVERDSIPQFVYELGGRLPDGGLRNTWVQHAESILTARGVQLPGTWADPVAKKVAHKKATAKKASPPKGGK